MNYSDLRGDMTLPTETSGAFTSIAINFRQGFAIAMNRQGREESDKILVGIEEALSAPQFDYPEEVIERIVSTCGGGAV